MRGETGERLKSRGWRQPAGLGLVGRALREREVVMTGDVRAGARLPRDGREQRDQIRAVRPAVGGRSPLGRAQHGGQPHGRLRPRRRQASTHRGGPGERGAAIGPPLRERRAGLPGHRRGPGVRAGGQGLLHGQAFGARSPTTRRPSAGCWGWIRPRCGCCVRRGLPRHRQARDQRSDPEQAGPADRRGARPYRTAHGDRRADHRPDRLPHAGPAAGPSRPRALGRRRLSRRARGRGHPARRAHHLCL